MHNRRPQRNKYKYKKYRYNKCRYKYRGADKSLARPGRKQARKHVRDARDFNMETRAVNKFFFFLQGKAPKEIRAILTETYACFLPGRAKDLTALYNTINTRTLSKTTRRRSSSSRVSAGIISTRPISRNNEYRCNKCTHNKTGVISARKIRQV